MTDDELERTPIATAPLSVLLLVLDPTVDVSSIVADWIGCLRELNRPFDVLVVKPGSMNLPKVEPGNFDSEATLVHSQPVDPAGEDTLETALTVDPLTERFPEAKVVSALGNGLGSLLRAGLVRVKEPLVIYTQANRHYHPPDLKKLLEAIDKVDLVTGVRTGAPIPAWLRMVDFCFSWFCLLLFGLPVEPRLAWLGWSGLGRRILARRLFGVGLQDPECTFCLVRRELLARIVIQSDGSFAPVEFLAKANFLNALMTEVPIAFTAPGAEPTFLQEALAMFRHPDFGPAFLPPSAATDVLPALEGGPMVGDNNPSPPVEEARTPIVPSGPQEPAPSETAAIPPEATKAVTEPPNVGEPGA